MSRRVTASIAIGACAASWGAIGVIVRELDMPPLAIAFFQEVLGTAAAAAAALLWRPAALRPPRPAVIALGLVLAAHFACLFAAVRETSVASAVLVTYSAPVFIALLAPALLRERVTRLSVVALGGRGGPALGRDLDRRRGRGGAVARGAGRRLLDRRA